MNSKLTQIDAANGVAKEKQKYEKPSFEVIILDVNASLLTSSGGTGAGFKGVGRKNWN
ncbi:MAG: hypothetical protein J6T70_04825 [Bacteroidales bacterium]|nr:hypothetical protein [Bacteroidales bacterium]